jgi:hypothetical protein
MRYHHKLARHLRIGSTVDHFLRRFIRRGCSEDQFWGYAAVRYCPEFRLAPVEDAIRFAIEGGLKEASAHYGQRPPFGCHQLRYLRMIRRFLQSSSEPPASWDEAQVWDLAGKAGLERPIEAR